MKPSPCFGIVIYYVQGLIPRKLIPIGESMSMLTLWLNGRPVLQQQWKEMGSQMHRHCH